MDARLERHPEVWEIVTEEAFEVSIVVLFTSQARLQAFLMDKVPTAGEQKDTLLSF